MYLLCYQAGAAAARIPVFSGIHLSPYHNGDAAWAPGPWRLVSVCPAFDANLGAGGSLSCPLVRAENDCIPYSWMVAEEGGGLNTFTAGDFTVYIP